MIRYKEVLTRRHYARMVIVSGKGYGIVVREETL